MPCQCSLPPVVVMTALLFGCLLGFLGVFFGCLLGFLSIICSVKGKVNAGDGARGSIRGHTPGTGNGGKYLLPAALSCCSGAGAS